MELIKTAAVLAGGLSQRMGHDKKFLEIEGENILKRMVDRLANDFDDIIIIGAKEENLPKLEGIRGAYEDALDIAASLVGIYTGLLKTKSQFLYVTACDMPTYNSKFVNYMKDVLKEHPKVMGCVTLHDNWIEPFNAFYNKDLSLKMEEFLKLNRKNIYHCIEKEKIYYIEEKIGRTYSPNWQMFSNLNTPQEVQTHLKRSIK